MIHLLLTLLKGGLHTLLKDASNQPIVLLAIKYTPSETYCNPRLPRLFSPQPVNLSWNIPAAPTLD